MRALVLNSAQSKRLRGNDGWVRATLQAVDQLAARGDRFVASVGTSAWELVLWRAASLGAPLDLICPLLRGQQEDTAREHIMADFRLSRAQATWTFLRSRRPSGRCKDTWAARDELAFGMADLVVPVSVRSGGRWETMLGTRAGSVQVEPAWRVPWVKARAQHRWDGAGFERWPDGFDASGGALVHFTRGCCGPWPGERAAEFYEAVARSEEADPRDAWHTLERIVREGRIRGSRQRIRGAARAACLTAMPLAQTSSLFRWRARYARPSFEPFGVALSLRAAVRLGARPVQYDRGASGAEHEPDALWRQGAGEGGAWLHEQEWRIAGDLDFAGIAQHEVAVLVATEDQAQRARAWCRFPVVAAVRNRDATCQSAQASNLR